MCSRCAREVHLVAGRAPKPGTDECLVGKGIAGNFQGMALGEKFELKKNRPVEVVGVFEAGRFFVRIRSLGEHRDRAHVLRA